MKEYIEILHDSFEDYEGKTHNFTIAAISMPEESIVTSTDTDEDVYHVVVKGLHIGISICSPVDKYDEKLGETQAIGRARKNAPALYSTEKGYINTRMVKALLRQEATYLKKNPEKYIANYESSKKKYMQAEAMQDLYDSMSLAETEIIDKWVKDPHYLDDVLKYIEYKKCVKQ